MTGFAALATVVVEPGSESPAARPPGCTARPRPGSAAAGRARRRVASPGPVQAALSRRLRGRVQPAGHGLPARVVPGVEATVRCPRDTACDGRSGRGQHAVEPPAALPGLDRVEHEFRSIAGTDDARHAATVAPARDRRALPRARRSPGRAVHTGGLKNNIAMERSVERVSMRRQQARDLAYWLSRPMAERIAAVEWLRLQASDAPECRDAEPRLQRVCRVAQRARR